MGDQELAENGSVVSIELGDHGRMFLTNWIEPSNL